MPDLNLDIFNDEQLLQLRLKDLRVSIQGSKIESLVKQFYSELDLKHITFHPKCYFADEWFVPEGEPIIGIPFYLANDRLRKLEKKMVREIEGGTKKSFMQLIRHEAGHVFNYAYRLYRKIKWRSLFGPFSKEYSDYYVYRPYSRNFVRHLDDWYAQCHPDEDFAETFAVWLTPGRKWNEEYSGWKALKKLQYVDDVMKQICSNQPIVKTAKKYYDVNRLTMKLDTYYKRKKRLYRENYPDFHDSDLMQIFITDTTIKSQYRADKFLRRYRKSIVNNVARWSGAKKFVINKLVQDLIDRCKELDLFVSEAETETLAKVVSYVTSLMMNFLVTGSFCYRK